jgi:hypothetical protein
LISPISNAVIWLIVLVPSVNIYSLLNIQEAICRKLWSSVVPYWVLILFFGVINIVLFSMPMAMRM